MIDLKLKPSVILKQVNEECVFAIDCESEEDSFYKFENASKFFIEALHKGSSNQEIIQMAHLQFSKISKEKIEKDFKEFLKTIKSFNLTLN